MQPDLHVQLSLGELGITHSTAVILLELLQGTLATVTEKITDHEVQELKELGIRTLAVEDKDLQDRVEDSENRTRRNNIWIRGLPESMQDLHTEIPFLLSALVPDLSPGQLILDRVHKALGPKQQGGPPKDIIAKVHYYKVKEAIMSTSRAAPNLDYKCHKYTLYTDLTSLTIQRHKQMKPITAALISHRIKYRWGYPFKLLFSHQYKPYAITSL
ncbi:hypothetical protein XELAEV_18033364mg [Xenopus laevis]|uniref:Uncharacterized protein n=1 Tax=Xenopus laevis TaxID=8355 RepID=A0A974HDW8_XENLA|nr:hypothetical protein XELAEV_18033364mg [Xenopus laevis]